VIISLDLCRRGTLNHAVGRGALFRSSRGQ